MFKISISLGFSVGFGTRPMCMLVIPWGLFMKHKQKNNTV